MPCGKDGGRVWRVRTWDMSCKGANHSRDGGRVAVQSREGEGFDAGGRRMHACRG